MDLFIPNNSSTGAVGREAVGMRAEQSREGWCPATGAPVAWRYILRCAQLLAALITHCISRSVPASESKVFQVGSEELRVRRIDCMR